MRRFLSLRAGLLALAGALLSFPLAAQADGVLERIAATGVMNAGARTDAVPFGYRLPDGKLGGLSVDVLEEIRDAIEARLKRPVELRLHPVTPADRIEKVQSAAIDIECGITTPTWGREELVDFSIPFFGNGTRILALRGAVKTLDDLHGKRIGVIKGSTTFNIITTNVPGAKPVEVADMESGVAMLERGEVDGLSNLGIVLRAQVEDSTLKSRVLLLPRTGALSYEAIACILPKNDSAWRDAVNRAVADMLEGVDQYRGPFMKLHDRWLGPAGPVYYPLDRSVAQRLAASVVWLK
jgi:polar amino acid transport system substrate-binding protein